MPRVKQVTARKDYPKFGITKGQRHYHWVLKTGPRTSREFRQATPPKRGQLTTSDFLSAVYDVIDTQLDQVNEPDDVQFIIDNLEQAKDEAQERLDNMPEGLQNGSTGELIANRVSACEEFISSIEDAKSTWESAISELGDEPSEGDVKDARDAFIEEVEGSEPVWE